MSPVQRCFRILNLVSLFVLAYGLPGWAEDLAIGVVEPQKVLDGTTAGKQVKDALADYVNTRQRLIESEEQDIKAMERSEEHTSELQSQSNLVCRLLLEKKKKKLY